MINRRAGGQTDGRTDAHLGVHDGGTEEDARGDGRLQLCGVANCSVIQVVRWGGGW